MIIAGQRLPILIATKPVDFRCGHQALALIVQTELKLSEEQHQALAAGAFPDDLEALGRATRESVLQYRAHVALIYVDVVEFEGRHIRKFYSDMASRFGAFLDRHPGRESIEKRLRPGVSPLAAIMVASRFLLQYYAVELVFGVPDHFGKDSETVLREIADILRHGMVRPD